MKTSTFLVVVFCFILSLSWSLHVSPHPHPTSMVNQQQRCAYYGCPCIFEKAGISYILLPVYLAHKGGALANNSVSYKTRIGSWSCLSAEERKLWKRAWLVRSGWPEAWGERRAWEGASAAVFAFNFWVGLAGKCNNWLKLIKNKSKKKF